MIEIPLTRGLVAVIDDDDVELVQPYSWRALKGRHTHYAMRGSADRDAAPLYMHSVISGYRLTDHINGNGLDNRRANLRPATETQNLANQRKRGGGSSQFKGVTWDRDRNLWLAQIQVGGRNRSLGRHRSEEDAARAYDDAARDAFGQYAAINFPRLGERGALHDRPLVWQTADAIDEDASHVRREDI